MSGLSSVMLNHWRSHIEADIAELARLKREHGKVDRELARLISEYHSDFCREQICAKTQIQQSISEEIEHVEHRLETRLNILRALGIRLYKTNCAAPVNVVNGHDDELDRMDRSN